MDDLDFDVRGAAAEYEETRAYYQERTRYWIREARRALSFAEQERVLRDRESYVDWMGNATWLLTEAAAWREIARTIPWGRPERTTSMVDSDTATVEHDDDMDDDDLFNKSVNTPIYYHRVPDIALYRTLLRMRSLVWERHYKDTITLLCRRYPNLSEESSAKRAKEYKDPKSPNYNKLSMANSLPSFGMLFDNELLLALCKSEEEQKTFKSDVAALEYYQGLINKFHLRDIMYETRRTSTVKARDWNYKERKSA